MGITLCKPKSGPLKRLSLCIFFTILRTLVRTLNSIQKLFLVRPFRNTVFTIKPSTPIKVYAILLLHVIWNTVLQNIKKYTISSSLFVIFFWVFYWTFTIAMKNRVSSGIIRSGSDGTHQLFSHDQTSLWSF